MKCPCSLLIVISGSLKKMRNEEEIVDQICQSRSVILFVAMGTPKKEYFIRDNFENLDVPVVMGVGGSFDVFAGLKKEAPSWLRKGFEWIYRLAQNPKNLWKRYLTSNPWFVYQVFKVKLGFNWHPNTPIGF